MAHLLGVVLIEAASFGLSTLFLCGAMRDKKARNQKQDMMASFQGAIFLTTIIFFIINGIALLYR